MARRADDVRRAAGRRAPGQPAPAWRPRPARHAGARPAARRAAVRARTGHGGCAGAAAPSSSWRSLSVIGSAGAHPDPGEQPQLGRVREQLDDRQVPQRPHRQPQPEQRGAAADEHLPADADPPAACGAGRRTARSRTRRPGTATAGCCAPMVPWPRWRSGNRPDRPGSAPPARSAFAVMLLTCPSCVLRVSRSEGNRQGPKTAQNPDQRPALGEARAGRGTVFRGRSPRSRTQGPSRTDLRPWVRPPEKVMVEVIGVLVDLGGTRSGLARKSSRPTRREARR